MAAGEVRWQGAGRTRAGLRRPAPSRRSADPRAAPAAHRVHRLRARATGAGAVRAHALVLGPRGDRAPVSCSTAAAASATRRSSWATRTPSRRSSLIQPGSAHTYATCQPQHIDALQAGLPAREPAAHDPDERDAQTASSRPSVCQRTALSGVDIRRVNSLYGSEGRPELLRARAHRRRRLPRCRERGAAGRDRRHPRGFAAGARGRGRQRLHAPGLPRPRFRDSGNERRHRGHSSPIARPSC